MNDRRFRLASRALLAVLAAVMLGTFLDYGLTGDEAVRQRYGRRVIRWYESLGADKAAVADVDISRDGGLFEILAGLSARVLPLDQYETRHLVVVLFGLLAFFSTHRLGRLLGGEAAGFFALVFLALHPRFYGHAFNNPKDIPFAGMFAFAAGMLVLACEGTTLPSWRRALLAALAVGLVSGERVAGLVLIGWALILWTSVWLLRERPPEAPPRTREAGVFLARWSTFAVLAWLVMLAFWPWAQTGPIRNPLRALQTFSRFWDCIVVYYDGRFLCSGAVSRFYALRWMSLTLPGFYAVALILCALCLPAFLRRARSLDAEGRIAVLRVVWLALVGAVPLVFIVVMWTPLYDEIRHLLFLIPLLATLLGVGVSRYFALRPWSGETKAAAIVLAAGCALTFVDMVRLHPYQAVYFNRLIAGGPAKAIASYEGDYWCLSYKEGAEWLQKRFAGARCDEPIRVAGHSILQQTAYYFRKTEEDKLRWKPVTMKEDPHFVLSTTRFNDHLRTPGRVIHRVDREGATLLYLFELKPPVCPAVAVP